MSLRQPVVPQPGQVTKGSAALREALQGFLALQPKITVETKGIVQAGDIALLRAKWCLHGIGPDGKPTQMTGDSIEVVRRQPDGTWCFVIDLPFGTE
jgi:ketosteroid isomerase-like protein